MPGGGYVELLFAHILPTPPLLLSTLETEIVHGMTPLAQLRALGKPENWGERCVTFSNRPTNAL